MDQYSHLQDLDLADDSPVDHNLDTIDVLIGSDHYWDVVTGGIIRGIDGPVAISSNLGWLLLGPSESIGDRTISNLIVEGREIDDGPAQDDTELEDRLRQFWDTEAIGIFEEIKKPLPQPFVTLKFDWTQGRYQVNLLWKADYRPLNNGYETCKARLNPWCEENGPRDHKVAYCF